MSKRDLRRKRRARKRRKLAKGHDTHHICFIGSKWQHGYAKLVRRFHYCKMELPKDTIHKAIHNKMKEVPVPSDIAAEYAYKQLQYLDHYGVLHDDDPLDKRLMILIALFECVAQPTARGFEKQLKIVQSFNKPP